MSDVKISYTEVEKTTEIFPDNPNFKWEGEYAPFEEDGRLRGWFRYLVEKFENFEHNIRSCIFRSYGHDYDDESQRYIKMPDGNTPSGNTNPMRTDLEEALSYRIDRFDDEGHNGWKIFERLTGWYDIDVVDGAVVEQRKDTLTRFIQLLGEDEYLSRYDPRTKELAITTVDADGNMKPIEYMFPLGPEDTDFVHYVVLEPEKKEVNVESDEDIINLIKGGILEMISNTGGPIAEKRALGNVMSKYSKQLRPHIDLVRENISKYVAQYNDLVDVEGLDPINAELEALPFQELDEEPGEGPLVETYKKIDIASILKKIKDKALKTRLERIRPPSKGKAGGVSWPTAKGGEYTLWITTDPLEMLTKTTGRAWGERNDSCENYDGCANRGPVSDVKYGNAIVWVYRRDNTEYRSEIGRFSLRWGDVYKDSEKTGARDVGVEIQVYPKSDAPWGFNILGAIGMILRDKGFLNYQYCQTPYTYLGYSDKASGQKVKIQYDSKIFLKGRGEVQVADANALVETATNEKLSYADAGYVITYGNTQALLALAQNPMIWIYETPLRRLVNKSMDIEQGPLLIRFLVETDVANFNFLQGLVNNLELFDDDYGDATNRNSLVQAMLRHFKCNDETHYAIREAYEGYFWEDTLIGGVDELDYFALLDSNSKLATNPDTPPIITSAPIELLDELTNKLISDKLEGDKEKRQELWFRFAPEESLLYNVSSRTSRGLYSKYRDFLVGIRHLIFCPNLSLLSYGKLLTQFNNIYSSKRVAKTLSEWEKSGYAEGCIFSQTLETVRKAIIASMALPLAEKDDWGYSLRVGGVNSLYLGLDSIPENLRYRIGNRQSVKTVRLAQNFAPEAFMLQPLLEPEITNEDSLWGLMIRNIRSPAVFDELWKNRNKYDISPFAFTLKMIDSKNPEEAEVDYLVSSSILAEAIVENHELMGWNEYLKYDFVKYNTPITDEGHSGNNYRKEMPEKVVDMILENPYICDEIGYNVVALWLTTGYHFNKFLEIVYSRAVGDYYLGGEEGKKGSHKKHNFLPPPPISEMNAEKYRVFSQNTDDISVLEIAACGGNALYGGLADNTNLPEDLQLKLILPSDLDIYGDNKWRYISTTYSGNYSQYLYFVFKKLCVNPNIKAAALRYIIKNAPELEVEIASNSSVSANTEFIEDVMVKNPLPIFHNPRLGSHNLDMVVDYFIETMEKSPPVELERFSKYIRGKTSAKTNLRNAIANEDKLDKRVLPGLQQMAKKEWMKFWRGGNYKKKMGLGSDNNAAPVGSKGKPMALVDEPILIDREHVIFDISLKPFSIENEVIGTEFSCDDCGNVYSSLERMDTHQEDYGHEGITERDVTQPKRVEGDEFWAIVEPSRMRQITDIEINDDGSISVEGMETFRGQTDKKLKETYKDVNQMYGFKGEFDFDEVPPNMEVGDELKEELKKKWNNDITLVLFDSVHPEDIEILPEWRMNLSQEELQESFTELISNPSLSEREIDELTEKLISSPIKANVNNPQPLTGGNYCLLDALKIYLALDKANRWTIPYINKNMRYLFGTGEVYRTHAFENLKPTGEILELSLSQDRDLIKGKLGLSLRQLVNLQHWILDKWGSQVPIRYIYQMIDNPTAEPFIIDSAKQIRRARINEFLEYAAGLNPDAMGAEEGVHRRNRLNWVTLEAPPQINNLLIEYVERIHPDDEAKQNELMDSLTSGKKNISLDRMIKVVRQQRGE